MPDASPQVSRSNLDKVAVVAPAQRKVGHQAHIPGRHPGSHPSGTSKTGFSDDDDSMDDSGNELREPINSTGKSVSLNPSTNRQPSKKSGKRVGVRMAPPPPKSDEDDDDDDFATQLKPLSARRKGSIAPISIHNSAYNASGNGSNGVYSIDADKDSSLSSPTPSAASISSLLREKLGQVPIPGMFRNKNKREVKLQVFVASLFLTIILLVGSIYIIHKEKELQVLFKNKPLSLLLLHSYKHCHCHPFSRFTFSLPSFSPFQAIGQKKDQKSYCLNINVNCTHSTPQNPFSSKIKNFFFHFLLSLENKVWFCYLSSKLDN